MELSVSIYVDGELRGSKPITTPCIIGRSKDADLSIGHRAMSRKHCELYEAAGKLFLRDCGSLNGTFFKGEQLENPAALSMNDEFVIGDMVFRIAPPVKPLTEEQKRLKERPTAAFTAAINSEDESVPMLKTVLEQAKPFSDIPPDEKSGEIKPAKVSPKNVRIVP